MMKLEEENYMNIWKDVYWEYNIFIYIWVINKNLKS